MPTIHPSLITFLAPGAFVLDLGCGTGLHARALRGAGFDVVGVDFDVDALSTARFLDESPGSYAAGRAETLPFAAAVFDAVLCVDVLHWSVDAAAFEASLREAWRVLRPAGLFFARLRLGDSSGEWFRADRALLDAIATALGVEWHQAPASDAESEDGSVYFAWRKPAPL